MTKFQALYQFFASFGIPAIEENAFYASDIVPEFPYITYNIQLSDFDGGQVVLNPSVWYRSTSWQEPEQKASEISQIIGMGGIQIPCEDGCMWIKRGTPFCAPMGDGSDKFIKRMYFNMIVEYFTTD